MMTDEISKFLEKIDSEHFNCVYSCNGMTLMRTEEYSNNSYNDHSSGGWECSGGASDSW